MSENITLYDRIGGESTVERLIDDFYERIVLDPELAAFFTKSDMSHQRSMFREFIAAAIDGPAKFTGKSISEAHQGRGIRTKHVQKFVDHLFSALKNFEIDDRDMDEIIARINTYSDEVTGGGTVDG